MATAAQRQLAKLRPFYFRTHPDFFAQHPDKRSVFMTRSLELAIKRDPIAIHAVAFGVR
jgi:hypothetical protein